MLAALIPVRRQATDASISSDSGDDNDLLGNGKRTDAAVLGARAAARIHVRREWLRVLMVLPQVDVAAKARCGGEGTPGTVTAALPPARADHEISNAPARKNLTSSYRRASFRVSRNARTGVDLFRRFT
jgi:hypothetical protein